MKKVGKTIRPSRYHINQIPYDYTVELTNRFKGLEVIGCLKNYGWRLVTLYRRQGATPSPRKRNAKRQKRKGKIYPFECKVQKNRKERYESLPQ